MSNTKYALGALLNVDTVKVMGDGARGMARVVLIGTFDGLSETWPCEAFMTGDVAFDSELESGVWYGIRFLNDVDHADWGTIVVPAALFDDMVVPAGGASNV